MTVLSRPYENMLSTWLLVTQENEEKNMLQIEGLFNYKCKQEKAKAVWLGKRIKKKMSV